MPSRSNKLRRARPLLGTFVEITATGGENALPFAVEAAFAAIERVQSLMSFHDATSDVSRINRAGANEIVQIEVQTMQVLARAVGFSECSQGAFDIVTAGALVLRGFLPAPEKSGLLSCDATWRDIELLPENRFRWRRKGWLDLGGIAKGYAVDCAVDVLRTHGMESAVVNAGGDLRCFGERQPVHVRHPDSPTQTIPLGWLCDGAIATSAGYFAGKKSETGWIDPLIDPSQHDCVAWGGSISVIAADCMTADALTKIVRLRPDVAPDILVALKAQAVRVEGERMGTCGLTLLQT